MKQYTEQEKLKALAIVNVFETSKAFGDYAACVVLDDGAGISYGFSQFTHRSGSLAAVVERYLKSGGVVGSAVMLEHLATVRDTSAKAIERLSANEPLKKALRAAAVTSEMKRAQRDTCFELYLKPAIDLCSRLGFTEPLSLAIIYDSIVHGSFHKVARTVQVSNSDERSFITAYVRRRDAWLTSIPRLVKTRYRTRFFLDQIAISNWQLKTPLRVQGVTLIAKNFAEMSATTAASPQATTQPLETPQLAHPKAPLDIPSEIPGGEVVQQSILEGAKSVATTAGLAIDKVDETVTGITTRTDRVKSVWATIGGSVGQAAWAIFGFFAGLPREVWITVAVIVGILTAMFLYRQIVLGRMRETVSSGSRQEQ